MRKGRNVETVMHATLSKYREVIESLTGKPISLFDTRHLSEAQKKQLIAEFNVIDATPFRLTRYRVYDEVDPQHTQLSSDSTKIILPELIKFSKAADAYKNALEAHISRGYAAFYIISNPTASLETIDAEIYFSNRLIACSAADLAFISEKLRILEAQYKNNEAVVKIIHARQRGLSDAMAWHMQRALENVDGFSCYPASYYQLRASPAVNQAEWALKDLAGLPENNLNAPLYSPDCGTSTTVEKLEIVKLNKRCKKLGIPSCATEMPLIIFKRHIEQYGFSNTHNEVVVSRYNATILGRKSSLKLDFNYNKKTRLFLPPSLSPLSVKYIPTQRENVRLSSMRTWGRGPFTNWKNKRLEFVTAFSDAAFALNITLQKLDALSQKINEQKTARELADNNQLLRAFNSLKAAADKQLQSLDALCENTKKKARFFGDTPLTAGRKHTVELVADFQKMTNVTRIALKKTEDEIGKHYLRLIENINDLIEEPDAYHEMCQEVKFLGVDIYENINIIDYFFGKLLNSSANYIAKIPGYPHLSNLTGMFHDLKHFCLNYASDKERKVINTIATLMQDESKITANPVPGYREWLEKKGEKPAADCFVGDEKKSAYYDIAKAFEFIAKNAMPASKKSAKFWIEKCSIYYFKPLKLSSRVIAALETGRSTHAIEELSSSDERKIKQNNTASILPKNTKNKRVGTVSSYSIAPEKNDAALYAIRHNPSHPLSKDFSEAEMLAIAKNKKTLLSDLIKLCQFCHESSVSDSLSLLVRQKTLERILDENDVRSLYQLLECIDKIKIGNSNDPFNLADKGNSLSKNLLTRVCARNRSLSLVKHAFIQWQMTKENGANVFERPDRYHQILWVAAILKNPHCFDRSTPAQKKVLIAIENSIKSFFTADVFYSKNKLIELFGKELYATFQSLLISSVEPDKVILYPVKIREIFWIFFNKFKEADAEIFSVDVKNKAQAARNMFNILDALRANPFIADAMADAFRDASYNLRDDNSTYNANHFAHVELLNQIEIECKKWAEITPIPYDLMQRAKALADALTNNISQGLTDQLKNRAEKIKQFLENSGFIFNGSEESANKIIQIEALFEKLDTIIQSGRIAITGDDIRLLLIGLSSEKKTALCKKIKDALKNILSNLPIVIALTAVINALSQPVNLEEHIDKIKKYHDYVYQLQEGLSKEDDDAIEKAIDSIKIDKVFIAEAKKDQYDFWKVLINNEYIKGKYMDEMLELDSLLETGLSEKTKRMNESKIYFEDLLNKLEEVRLTTELSETELSNVREHYSAASEDTKKEIRISVTTLFMALNERNLFLYSKTFSLIKNLYELIKSGKFECIERIEKHISSLISKIDRKFLEPLKKIQILENNNDRFEENIVAALEFVKIFSTNGAPVLELFILNFFPICAREIVMGCQSKFNYSLIGKLLTQAGNKYKDVAMAFTTFAQSETTEDHEKLKEICAMEWARSDFSGNQKYLVKLISVGNLEGAIKIFDILWSFKEKNPGFAQSVCWDTELLKARIKNLSADQKTTQPWSTFLDKLKKIPNLCDPINEMQEGARIEKERQQQIEKERQQQIEKEFIKRNLLPVIHYDNFSEELFTDGCLITFDFEEIKKRKLIRNLNDNFPKYQTACLLQNLLTKIMHPDYVLDQSIKDELLSLLSKIATGKEAPEDNQKGISSEAIFGATNASFAGSVTNASLINTSMARISSIFSSRPPQTPKPLSGSRFQAAAKAAMDTLNQKWSTLSTAPHSEHSGSSSAMFGKGGKGSGGLTPLDPARQSKP